MYALPVVTQYFYSNNCTFSVNHQSKSWSSRQHFETTLARLPANKDILEKPGPHGSYQPVGVMLIGHLGCWNDHLVSSTV